MRGVEQPESLTTGVLVISNLSAVVTGNVSGFILAYFGGRYEPGTLVTGEQTDAIYTSV